MRFNISRFFGKIRTKYVIFFVLAILIAFVIYKYFSLKEGAANEDAELPPGVTYVGLYKLDEFPEHFQNSYNYVVKDSNGEVQKDGLEIQQNRWNICLNHERCGGDLLGVAKHLGGDGQGGIYNTGCVYFAVSGPDKLTSFNENANPDNKGFSIFHNFHNKDGYSFDKTILKGMKKHTSVNGKDYSRLSNIDSIPDGYVAFFSSEKEDKCPDHNGPGPEGNKIIDDIGPGEDDGDDSGHGGH